ncbi:uncharacterized protein N7483_007145 [Penicillium malachiteum]|uniref:uncharacterized protein n=1 Tax=Penicillium malachiteum TaxID=1324776 RepID=UPI002548A3D0|nr:uncharacterized protein N7483_007145 [Penicillium malachiteum]KAJ5725788.1 hypothetical protein N7483_007145 [Penicillium malachiteum]
MVSVQVRVNKDPQEETPSTGKPKGTNRNWSLAARFTQSRLESILDLLRNLYGYAVPAFLSCLAHDGM